MTEQVSRASTYLHEEPAPSETSASDRPVNLCRMPFGSAAAAGLLAAADAFNASLYGHADETPLDPRQFDDAHRGVFLVAIVDGAPVACGGIRAAEPPAPEGAAEVKRMYVAEHARRSGMGRMLLAALEKAAAAYDYDLVVLDVGAKQEGAHRFYEAAGYHRIAGFSIYRDKPGNRAYGKTLLHESLAGQ